MARGFWHNRRVLVTGDTGFMGGWLTLSLRRLGAVVAGYALPPATNPSLFEAVGLAGDGGDRQFGDIRDLPALAAAVTRAAPELVFHLAAQPIVRAAYAAPVETYSTNVLGTVHLLEAVRRCPAVRAVVLVTTDKVYDNQEWAWSYRETDRLGGREPYGTSKACCELVAEAYRASYLAPAGVAVATVRAGNIIGGGDWAADRLIPDAIRAFQRGQPLVVRNPGAVRPWQHVLDMVRGSLLLAERLATGADRGDRSCEAAWNFGPPAEDCAEVGAIASRLAALWGTDASWRLEDGARPYEAHLLRLDSAQARQRLGWRPVWSLDQALVRSVAWYRAFLDGGDMAAVSLEQIDEHNKG